MGTVLIHCVWIKGSVQTHLPASRPHVSCVCVCVCVTLLCGWMCVTVCHCCVCVCVCVCVRECVCCAYVYLQHVLWGSFRFLSVISFSRPGNLLCFKRHCTDNRQPFWGNLSPENSPKRRLISLSITHFALMGQSV